MQSEVQLLTFSPSSGSQILFPQDGMPPSGGGSTWQEELHPSPSVVFPSSHASVQRITPSPHELPEPTRHVELQVSQFRVLPSSHSSLTSSLPLPQTGGGTSPPPLPSRNRACAVGILRSERRGLEILFGSICTNLLSDVVLNDVRSQPSPSSSMQNWAGATPKSLVKSSAALIMVS